MTPIHFYPKSFLNAGAMRSVQRFHADPANEGKLPIMEIFKAYEGEGSKIGTPRVLVRLGGCPVMCKNCDTIHSFNINKKMMKYQTLDEVVQRVLALTRIGDSSDQSVREVSITGGEPMMHPTQITALADKLRAHGFKISLETSGMIIDQVVFSRFDFVSLDVKAPSTAVPVTDEQLDAIYAIRAHHQGVQVKIVISDERDLEWVKTQMAKFIDNTSGHGPLIMTPNSPHQKDGVSQPASVYLALMQMIIDWNRGYNIVVIPQIHKLLNLDPYPEYLKKNDAATAAV